MHVAIAENVVAGNAMARRSEFQNGSTDVGVRVVKDTSLSIATLGSTERFADRCCYNRALRGRTKTF